MKNNYKQFIQNLVIFLFVIYLIITCIMYFLSPMVDKYEVIKGSISNDKSYFGIITYDSTILNSSNDGKVSYFVTEGERIKSYDSICVVNPNKSNVIDNLIDSNIDSTNNISTIKPIIDVFSTNFNSNNFYASYDFLMDLNKNIKNNVDINSIISSNQELINENGLEIITSRYSGVVSYLIDNYEGTTYKDIKKDMFSMKKYSISDTRIDSDNKLNICKVITSQDWQITINIDKLTYRELTKYSRDYIKLVFSKDNNFEWAKYDCYKIDNNYYCTFFLDEGLIRYYQDRFINIKLDLYNEEGLKIPSSAIIEKDFYKIPEEFIMKGGNSNSYGVMVKDENNKYIFKKTTIYYYDQLEKKYYINIAALNLNDILLSNDSAATFKIQNMSKLTGVYNINNGYSLFRRIEILYQNDEYAIIKEDGVYGVITYDIIAKNAKKIKDDIIIN